MKDEEEKILRCKQKKILRETREKKTFFLQLSNLESNLLIIQFGASPITIREQALNTNFLISAFLILKVFLMLRLRFFIFFLVLNFDGDL